MKARWIICAVAILCCVSAAAFADGTVFVQGMAKLRIPDQSALITFDGKTERLVIETAIEGEGTEFAWVVPVPSLPKVEAATPGLFPTLRMITRARVVGFVSHWALTPGMAVLFGILIWWAIYRRGWIAPVVIGVILLLLRGMMLSAGASAGASPLMTNGITVLDRKMVGLYETVTISGTDGKKVGDWLNNNGFKVPASKQDALAQYAKEGWVFVVGRIRRDSAAVERFTAHPFSFTFATSRAVYPMRLTGIENGPVAVDLYAVGNDEAVAAPFTRQRAGRPDFDARGDDQDDFIPLSHEALQSYCKGFSALTVLSATLSPEQMKDDLYLTWKPLSPFRHVYFMNETALAWASRVAAGMFLLASIVCAVRYWPRPPPEASNPPSFRDESFIVLMIVLLAPILLGSCVYLVLPKLPDAQVLKMHGFRFRYLFKEDHKEILEKLNELQPGGDTAPNLAAYKKEAASTIAGWREKYGEDYYRNPFSGLAFREEDSPGNYVIELKGDKPTYFYFDINGRKIELGVIGQKVRSMSDE